jgi:hypothetical protein
MTDRDEIADLADRLRGMSADVFEIEFGALTQAEQDEYLALMDQRIARGKEKLEAIEENVRILRLLFLHQQGKITGAGVRSPGPRSGARSPHGTLAAGAAHAAVN